MFQYGCGRALAEKHQTELILDLTQFINKKSKNRNTIRSFELGIFKINARIANKSDLKSAKPFFYKALNVLSIHTLLKGIQTTRYFVENEFSYNSTIEKAGKDCFLSGYWQSAFYFANIKSLIQMEFKFPNQLDENNERIVTNMKDVNAVSLHIRRKDFLSNKFHDIHGTCSIEYYKNAINYMANKVIAPVFYVFSDDIDWAKKNLNIGYPIDFVTGNKGENSYKDMFLMSLCKHNIISNSSFSWWGAWLNSNSDKVVIAPKIWFIDEKMNSQTKDLIPDNWIRI